MQCSKVPQNNQTADMQRQIQNAARITQDAAGRDNVSISHPCPPFSRSLGIAYFRADRRDDAEKAYKAAIAVDSKAGEGATISR